jgi:hypothetical protein
LALPTSSQKNTLKTRENTITEAGVLATAEALPDPDRHLQREQLGGDIAGANRPVPPRRREGLTAAAAADPTADHRM